MFCQLDEEEVLSELSQQAELNHEETVLEKQNYKWKEA